MQFSLSSLGPDIIFRTLLSNTLSLCSGTSLSFYVTCQAYSYELIIQNLYSGSLGIIIEDTWKADLKREYYGI
jgi:hypothetical protein